MNKIPTISERVSELRRQYPEAILLVRIGDFYEAFDSDAKTVSAALGLTLTCRKVRGAEDWPMTGFPHHQLEPYLKKLIANGHKVAVCEPGAVNLDARRAK